MVFFFKKYFKSFFFTGHDCQVYSIAWSPRDQYLLASGRHFKKFRCFKFLIIFQSRDRRILFWDVRRADGFFQELDHSNREYSRRGGMSHLEVEIYFMDFK